MTGSSTPKKPKEKPEFVCDFCRRPFKSDGNLLVHLCEQKRRYQQRDEKPVKLAYIAYQTFWQRSMRKKSEPSYASFSKSSLYTAFVRFGRHLIDLNAVNPLGFIDFLLHIEAPIDKWTSPTFYNTYIRELNKNETPLDALERNLILMQQWAAERNDDWRTFFHKIDVPLAALWIANGRISPWVLFLASSARDMMTNRFSRDQIELIQNSIDTEFWQLKIERHQDDVEMIREVLAEHGI